MSASDTQDRSKLSPTPGPGTGVGLGRREWTDKKMQAPVGATPVAAAPSPGFTPAPGQPVPFDQAVLQRLDDIERTTHATNEAVIHTRQRVEDLMNLSVAGFQVLEDEAAARRAERKAAKQQRTAELSASFECFEALAENTSTVQANTELLRIRHAEAEAEAHSQRGGSRGRGGPSAHRGGARGVARGAARNGPGSAAPSAARGGARGVARGAARGAARGGARGVARGGVNGGGSNRDNANPQNGRRQQAPPPAAAQSRIPRLGPGQPARPAAAPVPEATAAPPLQVRAPTAFADIPADDLVPGPVSAQGAYAWLQEDRPLEPVRVCVSRAISAVLLAARAAEAVKMLAAAKRASDADKENAGGMNTARRATM